MRLIIILAGLIVVILLGGGVAYLLIPTGDEPAEEAIEEGVEEEPEEEEHAEEGGHGAPAPPQPEEGGHGAPAPPQPQYIKMEVLTLPVVRGTALNHYLNVEASLQSPDKQTAREIQTQLPHLRDAIIRDLFRAPLTAARGTKVAAVG